MTQILELSDREFRIAMIHLLKVLMKKKFPLERHFSREMGTVRKNQVEMLKVKNINRARDDLDGLISKLDVA